VGSRVYFVPNNQNNVGVLNTETNVFTTVATTVGRWQSDKISHIDTVISHIDTVISHIDIVILRSSSISILPSAIRYCHRKLTSMSIPSSCGQDDQIISCHSGRCKLKLVFAHME